MWVYYRFFSICIWKILFFLNVCFNIFGLKDYFLLKYCSLNVIIFFYYILCLSKIICVLGYEVFK